MSHQQVMGGAGRGMGVPGMHPGGGGTGPGGAGAGGTMMPGGMNPRPAGMGMAPNNYPYQGGMAQGQMGMQPRPSAPPQYNPSMYQQPGQMPGMPNRFVGGQPGRENNGTTLSNLVFQSSMMIEFLTIKCLVRHYQIITVSNLMTR